MKKYFHILLFAGALIFSIQLSVAPLIHNHPFDLKKHYDCPAYILTINLVSSLTFLIIAISLIIPFLRRISKEISYQNILAPKFFRIFNKAPPIYFI